MIHRKFPITQKQNLPPYYHHWSHDETQIDPLAKGQTFRVIDREIQIVTNVLLRFDAGKMNLGSDATLYQHIV